MFILANYVAENLHITICYKKRRLQSFEIRILIDLIPRLHKFMKIYSQSI